MWRFVVICSVFNFTIVFEQCYFVLVNVSETKFFSVVSISLPSLTMERETKQKLKTFTSHCSDLLPLRFSLSPSEFIAPSPELTQCEMSFWRTDPTCRFITFYLCSFNWSGAEQQSSDWEWTRLPDQFITASDFNTESWERVYAQTQRDLTGTVSEKLKNFTVGVISRS